ncbi:MAG: hypothetical protein ACAI38_15375 [Myxococcota bacterium]
MMSRTCAVATLAATVVLHASVAKAVCDPGLVSQAVVARIQKESIEQVLRPLGALVPQQASLGQFDVVLGECGLWFDDTIIHFKRGTVHLANTTYAVTLVDGGIDIDIHGDIDATGDMDLEICALPDDSCDAHVVAHGVTAHARASIAVNQCVPTLVVDAFTFAVDHANVTIELTGCAAYASAFDASQEWLRDDLINYAAAEIEAFIPALIETQVAALTSDLIKPTTIKGIAVTAQPEGVAIDAAGITMTFGVKTDAPVIANCTAGLDSSVAPTSPPPSIVMPQATSVAISSRFAQNVVESAWRAGWLCLEVPSAAPAIDDLLATLVKGTTTHVTLNALAPPRVAFVASETGSATVELSRLSGHIAVTVPNDRDYTADFLGNLSIAADTRMRAATRELVLATTEASVTPLQITLGSSSLGFTQDGVDRFVRNAVMPFVTKQIGDLPIITGLFDAAYVAITIGALRTTNDAVIAEIGLVDIDASDAVPPTTAIGAAPVCPCSPDVAITVASTDNTTIGELMRHQVTVDGSPADSDLRAGAQVLVEGLADGQHTIHLAAVDLMGNLDPVGFDVNVDVDALPPTIRFAEQPRGIVGTHGLRLRIEAEDDTALAERIAYQVGIVSSQAVPDTIIRSGTVRHGEVLALDDLPDSATIRVRATAQDTAGNSAEASVTMAVLEQPTMGCGAVHGSWLGLVAGMFWLRRRRGPLSAD